MVKRPQFISKCLVQLESKKWKQNIASVHFSATNNYNFECRIVYFSTSVKTREVLFAFPWFLVYYSPRKNGTETQQIDTKKEEFSCQIQTTMKSSSNNDSNIYWLRLIILILLEVTTRQLNINRLHSFCFVTYNQTSILRTRGTGLMVWIIENINIYEPRTKQVMVHVSTEHVQICALKREKLSSHSIWWKKVLLRTKSMTD